MVLELADGPCIAMEVKCKLPESSTYSELRKLCGPVDTVSPYDKIYICLHVFVFIRLGIG